jgi:predicted outer membrane repeat protein
VDVDREGWNPFARRFADPGRGRVAPAVRLDGTRRWLLRLGAAVLPAAVLTALLGETGASRPRRQRRRARHDPGDDKENRKGKRKGRNNSLTNAGCLRSSADLQAAIDAANPGADLTLCPGTWTLTSTIQIGKNLTLSGSGASNTILDGGSQPGRNGVRVLRITAGVVTVQNLTIANGTAIDSGDVANGGGVAVDANATLNLTDCAVTNNDAVHDGGGIYNAGTTTVSGCTATRNTAEYGGGIYNFEGTLTLQMSDASGATCSVTGNRATVNGGGIYSWFGTVTSDDTAILAGNTPDNCAPEYLIDECSG